MSHDPRHIREATRRLELQRENHRREQAAYIAQTRERIPALEDLDKRIQSTVAMAIAAALRTGVDPTPAVLEAKKQNVAYQGRRLELLRQHGIDPASLDETPMCPLCSDTGWHGGRLCRCVEALCVEENERELAQQMKLEECSFDRFSLDCYSSRLDSNQGVSPRDCAQLALDVCRAYALEFPNHPFRSLFLHGDTGLGKTLLSCCVARAVAARGYWTVYETAGRLFGQYEAVKFGRDSSGDAQADLTRYEKCDLLVLDDLGSELTTPFVQAALYQLLNQRMLSGKHTLISSNLDFAGVQARYTPQVASRIQGECESLPFFGQDIRLQKKL